MKISKDTAAKAGKCFFPAHPFNFINIYNKKKKKFYVNLNVQNSQRKTLFFTFLCKVTLKTTFSFMMNYFQTASLFNRLQ